MKHTFEYDNQEIVQLYYEDLVRKGRLMAGNYSFNIRAIPNPERKDDLNPHVLVTAILRD